MIGKLWNLVSATLLATALCLLVVPPEIAVAGSARLTPVDENAPQPLVPELDAGFPPAHHDFAFRLPELGVEMKVLEIEGGFLFWQAGELDKWGFVPESDLERVQIETGGDGLTGRFTWRDSLGAPIVYQIEGEFDGLRSFHGTLSAPESRISHVVELIWAEDTSKSPLEPAGSNDELRNVSGEFVIILSAAVVAALVCGTTAILQECGSECADTCGDKGVDSYSEGMCGTCDCDCDNGGALSL